MTEFRQICVEPLKKSNLMRNGSLQIQHQLQCDQAFLQKALELQRRYRELYNEYYDSPDCDEDVLVALEEESRKLSHVINVFRNEISRMGKLERKIERDVGTVCLTEVPSNTADALMSPRRNHPSSNSEAIHITELMSQTKGNSLSRDDSTTASTSTPFTPLNGPLPRRVVLPNPPSKGVPIKNIPLSQNTASFDTSVFYTSFY